MQTRNDRGRENYPQKTLSGKNYPPIVADCRRLVGRRRSFLGGETDCRPSCSSRRVCEVAAVSTGLRGEA